MNILFTGISGFIGSNLSQHLANEHSIFGISRSINDNPDFTIINLDLSNFNSVREFEWQEKLPHKIDVIVNCAAVFSMDDPSDFEVFEKNNTITRSVIYIATQLSIGKLINFSSIRVYPSHNGMFDERSPIAPSSNGDCLYGLSKYNSEQLFDFYLGDKMQVVNLRLAQTYGKGMPVNRLYSKMLAELSDHNQITIWADGKRKSNFISIEYLQKVLDQILRNSNITGVFNLGQENISIQELAQKIIDKHGNSESTLKFISKGNSSVTEIDSSKLLNALNFHDK